jgi:signal transduction histidine kinase
MFHIFQIKVFKTLKTKLESFCQLKDKNWEKNRRELILNILICLSIAGFALINLIRLIGILNNKQNQGLPIIYTLLPLAFFIFFFFLSKKRKTKIVSWLFITIYGLPMIYCFYFWGTDLPIALITSILIIALCGILISARTAFISAGLINIFLISLTYLQNKELIKINNYWRLKPHKVTDALIYSALIMIITSVVLIFERQIQKVLARAKIIEEELKQKKELLEIKIEKRIKAIRAMETEKINQLYRFAEFGRISSGIFHDLINPLTAVSLSLEQISYQEKNNLGNTKNCLMQAILASRKMENLIGLIKKFIKQESSKSLFFLFKESWNIIQLLNYKARQAGVEMILQGDKHISYYGDAIKFNQIITNLLCNGIEAYEKESFSEKKEITLKIKRQEDKAVVKISDRGEGINPENINKIFQPFFTTKKKRGLGLGLSSAKTIIEKDFNGSIEVISLPSQETTFIIQIPLS